MKKLSSFIISFLMVVCVLTPSQGVSAKNYTQYSIAQYDRILHELTGQDFIDADYALTKETKYLEMNVNEKIDMSLNSL